LNVLLDELAAAEVADLQLPMATDARLRTMIDLMTAAPADRNSMEVWAPRVGPSERTLARLISRETGTSFGRWRQQFSVTACVRIVEWKALRRSGRRFL
jgi:transcriptional regulator GlxA family with amidase domain